MPGFNVENFKSEVAKRSGVMRNNRFLMTFVPPPVVSDSNIGRSLEYWCESVALPGYQLMMSDTRRWTYGPMEKRPFAPNTISLQSVFLGDGNGDMLKFFSSWMNNIIAHYVPGSFNSYAQGTRVQGAINGAIGSSSAMTPYEVRYKQQYATDLHIYVYRPDETKALHYVVKEAFPSNVLDIPVTWEATNNFIKFAVTFDYLDWYMEEINLPSNSPWIYKRELPPVRNEQPLPRPLPPGIYK